MHSVQCEDAFGSTGSVGGEEHADLWVITLDEDESMKTKKEKKLLLRSRLLPLNTLGAVGLVVHAAEQVCSFPCSDTFLF